MSTLKQEWDVFSSFVFEGITPDPKERAKLRSMFYSGAIAMYNIVEGFADIAEKDALEKEIEDYNNEPPVTDGPGGTS